MAIVHFVTGGQRSGKSSYAQTEALKKSAAPHYIATARHWDEDFTLRIERHKLDRGNAWKTHEIERNISNAPITNQVAVLDCITLWLTNIFVDTDYNAEKTLAIAKNEWAACIAIDCELYVISNEIGMGGHAPTETARAFTDIQGFMNQYIASTAQSVVCMISGIPLLLK